MNLQRICKVLFMPMVENFQGQGKLARFHVFLGWSSEDDEAATEKAVMGGEYDSALEGKVAFKDREMGDPHTKRLGC